MSYSVYKKQFPKDVLIYIEEYNKQEGTILFDFIESNEYRLFTYIANLEYDLYKPSMVILRNYYGKNILENTIYSIKEDIIQFWREQNLIKYENINSYLIGYEINMKNSDKEIFRSSVSLNDETDYFLNYYMLGGGDISKISIQNKGKISVIIRNIGHGNWNEISFNDEIKFVYDAGAPTNATKSDVTNIIGNRNTLYANSKPILILSHWDKDHYHSLIGMTDSNLKNNFSAFVCRDRVPNLTSRLLFIRILNAIGIGNTFSIAAESRDKIGGPTYFTNLNPLTNQVILYNAQYHKNRNISGIAISLKTRRGSVILSGDAHYEQISRDMIPHLNYKHSHHLIVPHHGGNAGNFKYKIPELVKVKNAIISVGANHYGHPFSSNINSLRSHGFKVHQTNLIGKDFNIDL